MSGDKSPTAIEAPPKPAGAAAAEAGKGHSAKGKARAAKNIILFSDGTGNSSGKLFKTNVWRMYEAVDLGPSPPDKRDQIAYYDNGVGTSTFKPMAILSGIFGIGLKRNVLNIYRYACRNYRPASGQKPGADTSKEGDYIYAFGFSRGAFTVRMLIGLIADQGLVPYSGELDLLRDSEAAYRQFRQGRPRYPFSPMRPLLWAWRKLGDLSRIVRGIERYSADRNYRPVIRFVGVWDTVAAYGGPIAELTRAVDNWVYRLSMPNQELHPRVQTARHALALDDARDSFQPLLWDEVHEQALLKEREADPQSHPAWITPDRLEQVWFCGMHADVGGGYPDESLSYVSLLWIIEEAGKAGIRTLTSITEPYRALANSFGPMHDSRAGLASYYRYQPRNISAWVDSPDRSTLSLRDPQIENGRGLLTSVKIHESVIARIASGTDRYAPFSLPAEFVIHPPGELAEHLPQGTSEGDKPLREADRLAMVDPQDEERLSDPERTRWARDAMGPVWDLVWYRRLTYFVTLFCTLALLGMPLWIGIVGPAPFLNDGRTWASSVIHLGRAVAPAFLGPWIRVYEHNVFYTLLLFGLILVLTHASNRLELSLRDETRGIWRKVLTASSARALSKRTKRSVLERVRTSTAYQRGLQIVKWHVLPNIFGPALLFVAMWAVGGLVTQMRLPGLEANHLCPLPAGRPEVPMVSRDFRTRALCNPMNFGAVEGQEYDVSIYVVDPWMDSSRPATPAGLKLNDYPWGIGYAGEPYKRVVDAGYLQPIVEIRPPHALMNRVYIYPLQLKQSSDDPTLYRARFVAPVSGDLYMFANDAVLPFTGAWAGIYNVRYFYEWSGSGGYRGNQGSACVLIAKKNAGGENLVKAASPICLRAAQHARDVEKARASAPAIPYLAQ